MKNIEKIKEHIKNLIDFLNAVDSSSFFEQMNYLQGLLDLADNQHYDLFLEQINGAELWGGSGSVWESENGMTAEQRKFFENSLLQLLFAMNEDRILKQRAKSVFKILSKKGE